MVQYRAGIFDHANLFVSENNQKSFLLSDYPEALQNQPTRDLGQYAVGKSGR